MMSEEFDLFGNLVQSGRGCKGRPPFQVTDKDTNKIKLLLALGWTNSRIACALDISTPTLKRHFRSTLKIRDEMRDRLDARRFEVVSEHAFAGNVTAMKELGRMIEKSDNMRIAKSFTMAPEDTEEDGTIKPPRIGKKRQNEIDAATPNDTWGFLPHMPNVKH